MLALIATIRETDIAAHVVHGNGRKPDAEFVPDLDAIKEFNAGTARAVRWNRDRPERDAARDRRRLAVAKREGWAE